MIPAEHYCGVVAGFLGVVPAAGFLVVPVALCATGCRVVEAAPPRTIVKCTMRTGVSGLSLGPTGRRAIFFTRATLASSHCPKIVWRPDRWRLCAESSVMKNCEPLVLGPELAIAKRPGRSNFRVSTN